MIKHFPFERYFIAQIVLAAGASLTIVLVGCHGKDEGDGAPPAAKSDRSVGYEPDHHR
jgi:hypothetical protein